VAVVYGPRLFGCGIADYVVELLENLLTFRLLQPDLVPILALRERSRHDIYHVLQEQHCVSGGLLAMMIECTTKSPMKRPETPEKWIPKIITRELQL